MISVRLAYWNLGRILLLDFDSLSSSLRQIGNLALVSVRYMQRHATAHTHSTLNLLMSWLRAVGAPEVIIPNIMRNFRIIRELHAQTLKFDTVDKIFFMYIAAQHCHQQQTINCNIYKDSSPHVCASIFFYYTQHKNVSHQLIAPLLLKKPRLLLLWISALTPK